MRTPKTVPMRFTRLKLVNWRNFQTADVKFENRAFIVGPNASGKSNLLDAMRFLAEIARPGSGGLQAAIEGRGGFSALRCLQARNPPYVELEAYIGTRNDPEVWRYFLRINIRRPEKLAAVQEESITHYGSVIVERIRLQGDDFLDFSQTLLEQVGASRQFRELAEFLSSCRYLHVVPQIVRDRARARAEGEDPYGGNLLRRIKETPSKTRNPRLTRISRALEIAVPQFREIELKDDSEGVPHLYASYVHWRASASKQSESYFSDGTLRLIGLLWSIAERGGPLLLEEPELSLNDAVVNELPRMFLTMQRLSGRQIIITTHSSTMLDDNNIGLREVHRISVNRNGSSIETIQDNPKIAAQIHAGMTTSQAVLPLLRPEGIEKLGVFDITNRN